jgi:hypothetical protein
VRVTKKTHPLFGRLLPASGFKRLRGTLYLVVTLPDRSVATIPASATNVFGDAVHDTTNTVLTGEGLRQLLALVDALRENRVGGKRRK